MPKQDRSALDYIMSSTKISNIIKWETNSSRISIFPLFNGNKTVTPEIAIALWPKSQYISKKNTKIADDTGQITIEGEYKSNKLLLIGTPFKIDLIIVPKEPVNVTSFSLQTLGLFSETIPDVNELAKIWFTQDNFPEIQRLAFATELVFRVKSHEDAYKLMAQYLPFPLDGKTSSEFMYQINQFTTSEVEKGLKINKINTWDALRLNLEIGTSQLAQKMINKNELYYCHLKLDINTDLENKKPLNKKSTNNLYQELVNHAVVTSNEGIK
jgi:hypothetical protein